MNDFLHNLRSKQNKRYEGNRRQYPNTQYQGRNGKDNRKQQVAMASAVETLSASLSENLPVLKTILEGISNNQEKMAEAEDRMARAEERKAIALEKLVEYAGKLLSSSDLNLADLAKIGLQNEGPSEQEPIEAVAEEAAAAEAEAAEAKYEEAEYEDEEYEDNPTRDDVLNMICGLREEGLTYDQIAKQLESESVSTFSGKGKWRGQTVHRLYQKMTS